MAAAVRAVRAVAGGMQRKQCNSTFNRYFLPCGGVSFLPRLIEGNMSRAHDCTCDTRRLLTLLRRTVASVIQLHQKTSFDHPKQRFPRSLFLELLKRRILASGTAAKVDHVVGG